MSKLEDKLAASIKPARRKPTTAKAPPQVPAPPAPGGAPAPMPVPQVRSSETPEPADLNSSVQPPHPRRIWPD